MKKIVSLLAIVAFTNPLLSAYAHSIGKKMKDEIPTAAPTTYENYGKWSGLMTLTTNYMFRGISQSANNPAAQGGLTYTAPFFGLYANLWGSNVDFFAPDGERATVEFDTIIGFKGGEEFTYDLNVARYNYPRARAANYNEFNSLFFYKFIQLGFSYTGNYAGTHGNGAYYNANFIYTIPQEYIFNFQDLTFQAGIGHYSLANEAGNSYNDYNITLSKKLSDIYTITAQWTGTNGKANLSPYDNNQLVGTITANF